MHVRQAELPALEPEREPFMVDSETIQESGVEIVNETDSCWWCAVACTLWTIPGVRLIATMPPDGVISIPSM